jgi:hypothetical protein
MSPSWDIRSSIWPITFVRLIAVLASGVPFVACDDAISTRTTAHYPPSIVASRTVAFGQNQYVEYRSGRSPLIIAVPHDGTIVPVSIPTRTYGNLRRDIYVSEIADVVDSLLTLRWGMEPHVILCHLHRTKLDAGVDSVSGAQGNAEALRAWVEYHGFIEAAKKAVEASFGRGLFFDLHGHSHPDIRMELGYLLTRAELQQSDAGLNRPEYRDRSSIRALATRSSLSFAEIVRGPNSLGGMLNRAGFAAVPSPQISSPGTEEFFSGGYSEYRHGSIWGGSVDAILFEVYREDLRASQATAREFGVVLEPILADFMMLHYAFPHSSSPPSDVGVNEGPVDQVASSRPGTHPQHKANVK